MSIIVKKISDQTVKTFNAVLAMARKTSELAPAFAVTFMPAMVDCRKWATARSSRDDLASPIFLALRSTSSRADRSTALAAWPIAASSVRIILDNTVKYNAPS